MDGDILLNINKDLTPYFVSRDANYDNEDDSWAIQFDKKHKIQERNKNFNLLSMLAENIRSPNIRAKYTFNFERKRYTKNMREIQKSITLNTIIGRTTLDGYGIRIIENNKIFITPASGAYNDGLRTNDNIVNICGVDIKPNTLETVWNNILNTISSMLCIY